MLEDLFTEILAEPLCTIDQASTELAKEWGFYAERPKMRGWTSYNKFLACPRMFKLAKDKVDVGVKLRFEMGIAIHFLLECKRRGKSLEIVKDALLDKETDAAIVLEAFKIASAYCIRYANEPFEVVAIEEWLIDPVLEYCSRIDLGVRVTRFDPFFPTEGFWILDYKSTSRFDDTNKTKWKHDGELLGLAHCYIASGQPYGPLQGVVVDLIGKQKAPKFLRIPVLVRESDLTDWRQAIVRVKDKISLLDNTAQTCWEKNNAACVGRYGPCDYYDICW